MEGTNPIKRKPLVVSGHDSEVVMDLMDTEDNHEDACRSLALRAVRSTYACYSSVASLS